MFTGSYPMTVDAKARVTLPAAFRSQIDAVDGKKTLCLLPMKDCVHGYPVNAFEKYVADLFHHDSEGEDSSRRNRREDTLKRALLSRVVTIDLDSAGRVALGKLDASRPGVRENLGLTSEVTVIGVDDHFEVWNTQAWDELQQELDEELDKLLFGE